MKMFKMMIAAALLIGFQANANMITIEVDNTSVEVGESVNVSLFASLTDAIDTIDFNFNFDNSLFSFVAGSESTELPNDGFFNFFSATPNSAGLGLGFTSLFDTVTGDFLLASFKLARTQAGDTAFSLDVLELASFATFEKFGLDLVDSVNVSSEVPAPATFGFLALAGLALFGFRRKA